MLRITVHYDPQAITFQLEGRLTGPWLHELATCWREILSRNGNSPIHVDLSGVTFIDAPGRAHLSAMRRQGAEFVTADCEMKAIADEVIGQSDLLNSLLNPKDNGLKKDNPNGQHVT